MLDDFFELGGHSLLATKIAARLQAAFGTDLPVRAVFSARTVAALAGLVYDRSGGVLVFAVMADQIPSAAMLDAAAGDIDAAASALAACGCR